MAYMKRINRKIKSLFTTPDKILKRISLRIINQENFHVGRFIGEYCLPPESIGIHLTKRCNLRCEMCFLWANRENPSDVLRRYKAEEMDFTRWKKIIDEVSFYKPSIGLSGGEPLLYESVLDVIKYIKQKKMYCSLNTNGMLLSKFAEQLVKTKMDMIRISIDGPPDIHDQIRGVKGSFKKLMQGIGSVNKEKEKLSSRLPLIEIYFTLTVENYTTMVDVLELIEDKGINAIKFIHPLFMSDNQIRQSLKFLKKTINLDVMDYLSGGNVDHVNLPPEQLIRELIRIKTRKNKVTVWFFPDFNDNQIVSYYHDHENFALKFKGRCRVPWFTVIIKPNGDVETCPEYRIGNVSNEKFLKVWNSEQSRTLRRIYREQGHIPLCHGCCNTYRHL